MKRQLKKDLRLIRCVARSLMRSQFYRSRLGDNVRDYYGHGFILLTRARQLYRPEKGKWRNYAARVLNQEFKRDACLTSRLVKLVSWRPQEKELLGSQEFGPVFEDTKTCDSTNDHVDNKEEVARVLSMVTQREKEVLVKRYFDDKDFLEIAQEYGVSKQAIDCSRTRAISKIRKTLGVTVTSRPARERTADSRQSPLAAQDAT